MALIPKDRRELEEEIESKEERLLVAMRCTNSLKGYQIKNFNSLVTVTLTHSLTQFASFFFFWDISKGFSSLLISDSKFRAEIVEHTTWKWNTCVLKITVRGCMHFSRTTLKILSSSASMRSYFYILTMQIDLH